MRYIEVYKMCKKASETQQRWWSSQGAKKGLSTGARLGGVWGILGGQIYAVSRALGALSNMRRNGTFVRMLTPVAIGAGAGVAGGGAIGGLAGGLFGPKKKKELLEALISSNYYRS